MMRAVIYARYSSENQREASIDDQIEVCRRLIERQGWQLTETYADRSISGANAANRLAFQKMIAEGKGTKKPLAEAFGNWKNLKVVLLALFGLTMGQAVVWYTGQFYAQFFLEKTLKLDGAQEIGRAHV